MLSRSKPGNQARYLICDAAGNSSIIHEADRVSILLDLSQEEIPRLWQFRFFSAVGQEDVDHETLEILGLEKLRVNPGRQTREKHGNEEPHGRNGSHSAAGRHTPTMNAQSLFSKGIPG